MSTLAYAALTTKRDDAQPNTSTSTSAPGVRTYVDAIAALVPAEVLTLHALMLTSATQVTTTQNKVTQTTIGENAVGPFFWAFVGLILLSIALYAIPRIRDKKWDRLDWFRSSIPPLAFVGWTMLQRTTGFDAAVAYFSFPPNDLSRTYIGLFLAVVLGLAATSLAYMADQKTPPLAQAAPAPAAAPNPAGR